MDLHQYVPYHFLMLVLKCVMVFLRDINRLTNQPPVRNFMNEIDLPDSNKTRDYIHRAFRIT